MGKTRQYQCIYCLESMPASDFNREHVLHAGFGGFKNALTLSHQVCGKCNSFFSNGIDIYLLRDSFEGRFRLANDSRKAEGFNEPNSSRSVKRLAEGECKGAIFFEKFDKTQGKIDKIFPPQIGFFNARSKEYDYFRIENIPSKKFLIDQGFDTTADRAYQVLGCSEEDATLALQKIGLKFELKGIIDEDKQTESGTLLEYVSSFDDLHKRAIAKIAFNYLAYITLHNPSFIFRHEFDLIRDYIRYEKQPAASQVIIRNSSIRINYDDGIDRPNAHIVAVEWKIPSLSIISQVSLFHHCNYYVVLGKDIKGIYWPLSKGHYFDNSKLIASQLKETQVQIDLPAKYFC